MERLLKFIDCSEKTESEIAQIIARTLEDQDIPFTDCRAQGYDIGANISGKCNGAPAIIKEQFHTAILSPCGCHTLNFCGNNAAECIPEALEYF